MLLRATSFQITHLPTSPGGTASVRLTAHFDLPAAAVAALRLDTLLETALSCDADPAKTAPASASVKPQRRRAAARSAGEWGAPQFAAAAGLSRDAVMAEVRRQIAEGAGPLATARLKGRGFRLAEAAARTWLAARQAAAPAPESQDGSPSSTPLSTQVAEPTALTARTQTVGARRRKASAQRSRRSR